jgi:serine/threonine protein kinase
MRPCFAKDSTRGVAARDLHLGAVLDGRYRIDIAVPSSGLGSTYLATHLGGGQFVKIVEVPAAVASALGRAVLVSHPALTTLLELLPMPGGQCLAVFELVSGQTLEEELGRRGRLRTKDAVACALAVADALVVLHGRRAAHGLLRPASIVLKAAERGTAVLSFTALLAPPNPYQCPERGTGAPSPADDVWALGATLCHALIGRPPPATGYGSADEIGSAGVAEPWLVHLLAACLATRASNRISLIRPVYDTLAAGSPSAGAVAGSLAPRSSTPRPVAAALAHGSRIRVRLWMFVVALAAVLGVLLWRVRATGRNVATPAIGSTGPLSSQPPAAPPSSSIPPVASAEAASELIQVENLPSAQELADCVMRQFPRESFLQSPKVDWLCSTSDPRKGVELMRAALVRGSGQNRLTEAMNLWSRLRWFGMAGFAVVRAACCRHPDAFELPEQPNCGPTVPVIESLADTVIRNQPLEAALGRYRKHMACQSYYGRAAQFGLTTPLGGGQEQAFLTLLAERQGR